MRKPLIWTLLLVMLGGAVHAADQEPSPDEMLAAIEQRYAAANTQLRDLQQRCAQTDFKGSNDPTLAMQCLSVAMAGAGAHGGLQFQVNNFEKIACAKADGQPGYVCDYFIGMSSNSPQMGGAMGDMMRQGGAGQGRFIKRQDSWLFLPNNQ